MIKPEADKMIKPEADKMIKPEADEMIKAESDYIGSKEISDLYGISANYVSGLIASLQKEGKVNAYKQKINERFSKWRISRADAEKYFSSKKKIIKKEPDPQIVVGRNSQQYFGFKRHLVIKACDGLKNCGEVVNFKNVKNRLINESAGVSDPYIWVVLQKLGIVGRKKEKEKEKETMNIEKVESVVKFIKANFNNADEALDLFEKMNNLFSSIEEAKKYVELIKLFHKSVREECL